MSDERRIKKSHNNSKADPLGDIKSILPPEVLSVKQEITTDDLKDKFPHLHSEMTEKMMQLNIEDVEGDIALSDETDSPLASADPFRNFEPSTLDYIYRAKTDEEAEEIIQFSLKQGNITPEEAKDFFEQLREKGVRSFGPIRTSGHYFRKAVEARNRQIIKKRYSIPK
jgi:hypothetical protein